MQWSKGRAARSIIGVDIWRADSHFGIGASIIAEEGMWDARERVGSTCSFVRVTVTGEYWAA